MPKKAKKEVKEEIKMEKLAPKERYFSKLNRLFFHTRNFINSIENEKDVKPILYFYVKIALFSIIISLIFSMIALSSNFTGQGLAVIIFSALLGFGFAFATPFISAGIIHLGVLIFRGKQGFFNTFKPIAYGMVINSVYMIVLGVISGIIGIVSPQPPVTNYSEIFANKTLLFSFLVTSLFSIVALIHVLYENILGIAKYQKMTKGKAFLSMLIIGLIILIVAAGIAVLYAYLNPSAFNAESSTLAAGLY